MGRKVLRETPSNSHSTSRGFDSMAAATKLILVIESIEKVFDWKSLLREIREK